MHYSPLQQALNPILTGRYVSPLAAVLNQRPPRPLINIGVTPSSLLAVLAAQDRQRNAMLGAALDHFSSIGNIDSLALLNLMEQLPDEDEIDDGIEIGDVLHAPLDSVALSSCRESVKSELADLEKQRKALSGQQNALNRRFAEVEGKFQLLKQLEGEATTNNAMNAEVHDKAE